MDNLRLRPGVIIVLLQWVIAFILPRLFPGASAIGIMGGVVLGLVLMLWWGFFSRAPRFERWSAIVLWVFLLVLASRLTHESIRTAGQGILFFAHAIPLSSLGFMIWVLTCRNLPVLTRRLTLAAILLMTCGAGVLVRSEGMDGEAGLDLAWRWSETQEEHFLSQIMDEQMGEEIYATLPETEPEWPGFRGSDRNSSITGTMIETDWSVSPPVEIWRRPVGPGCSSFAVLGPHLYTQEQIGEEEAISCYDLKSGKAIWKHTYEARFWDSHAGAGPRSTPTIKEELVYAFGATGILTVVDALDGSLIWTVNVAADAGIELPGWGFASSPLVLDEAVIVAIAGKVVAYDLSTGKALWFGPDGGESYSSPQLFTVDGVEQILLMNGKGALSFRPSDGEILWELPMDGAHIVQPALCENDDLLLDVGGAKGLERISVMQESGAWNIQEHWKSNRLKPNFNDFVIHQGHAYGFEGPSLACLDLEDGQRKWKAGRYGGQMLLLSDQDLLMVLTETGDLALVEARPDQHHELARLPAIEGKTWNHPVLTHGVLLVRNAREMAAFRLAVKD